MRKPYPNNVKDAANQTDPVQPVAVIGFYLDSADDDSNALPVRIISGGGGGTFTGLTNEQLRAAPVDVAGPLTNAQLRAASIAVTGPVTDAQLRATALPVSGPVTDAQMRATALPVSGPVTDAQLRANPIPIGGTVLIQGMDGATARTMAVTASGALNTQNQGNQAHGAADNGNPLKVGGFANSAPPAAVVNGQRVNAWYNLNGAQVVSTLAVGAFNAGGGVLSPGGMTDPTGAQRPLATGTLVTNGTGDWQFMRTVASADGSFGTAVLGAGILGQYQTTFPTYTAGQYGTLAMSQRGVLCSALTGLNGSPVGINSPSDGAGIPLALDVRAWGMLYDGTAGLRARGDTSGAHVAGSQYWRETTSAVAANATINGAARLHGGSQGAVGTRHNNFVAEAYCSAAGGTMYIDASADGTTWLQWGSIAGVAGSTVSLKAPITESVYRVRFVNGANAQSTFALRSAFATD